LKAISKGRKQKLQKNIWRLYLL